jgi:hypothetical protein
MSYDKKLRIRRCFNLILVVCGFASIVVGLLPATNISAFSKGYFCGLGFSLLAGGAVNIVKIISVLRDEEKLKAKRIKEEDERNTALNLTSSHIALFSMIFLTFIATFYYAFNNEEILHVMASFIIISCVVKLISYMILQKRM